MDDLLVLQEGGPRGPSWSLGGVPSVGGWDNVQGRSAVRSSSGLMGTPPV